MTDLLSIKSVPWILISGSQGVGKSTLSATGLNGFGIDVEEGSAIHFDDAHRIQIPYSSKLFDDTKNLIEDMKKKGVYKDKVMTYNGVQIAYIVIDTFDTMQTAILAKYLESMKRPGWIKPDQLWAPKFEQNDWGTLLNYQRPFLAMLKTLPIPVVICAHTKETDPIYKQEELRKPGRIELAIGGSIKDLLMSFVHYGLFIGMGEGDKRTIRTQPGRVNDTDIMVAKDKNRLFSKLPNVAFEIDPVTGKCKKQWIDFILSNHVY